MERVSGASELPSAVGYWPQPEKAPFIDALLLSVANSLDILFLTAALMVSFIKGQVGNFATLIKLVIAFYIY